MSNSVNETSENGQYDDEIIDSNAIAPTDAEGNPIPVTIPIDLAPGIKVVYTTRLGGVSAGDWGDLNLGGKSGDNPAAVRANRVALAKAVGAPLSLVAQVHSGRAVDVDEMFETNAPYGCDFSGTIIEPVNEDGPETYPKLEADAEVTAQTGIALGMFAADCLPVLLADAQAGVIGAAHCGRKGLQRGVIGSAVDLMVAKGAKPNRIVATLGPCICGDCYEVGDQIADEFDAQFPATFTLTRFGGPGIDIAKAALQELAKAGIPADNVISSTPRVGAATQYLDQDAELADLCAADGEGEGVGSPDLNERMEEIRHSLCTLENPLWYSHRRSSLAKKQHEGRLLALIVRE
ncbi:polyphenol oxidase family protein [Bifidobacterium sp. ESL0798]|uniref:polyphenol oxidase family protein n=1 Tax=Bifidobacterium sp. ESL0798 TaxID=2983235 RepID=UPI0023F829CC|nr:polyphenol oxidase family protein [Bifidobacterium sp. ESL0798]WEV74344.1 polyphenol oxidase family protein [Bifidobacterium sp. ESL0798]